MNKESGIVSIVIGMLTATIPVVVLFRAVTFLFILPLVVGILCIGLGIAAIRSERKNLRHVGSVAAAMMLIAIVLPFGLMEYYNRSGHPVVMIIPEGYRGPVRLVIDKKQGADVPLQNGTFTYQIPRDGTLRIKDGSPFKKWHSMIARYANGKPIPTDFEGAMLPETVRLHSIGAAVRTHGGREELFIEDFVGTDAELQQYLGGL